MHQFRFIAAVMIATLFVAFPAAHPAGAQVFTRITDGPQVNDGGASRSVNWVDVNGDGFLDLFVSNGLEGGENNALYISNGPDSNFTFRRVTGDPIVMDGMPSDGSSWGDVDNDGDPDAFVVNWYNMNNMFSLNQGDGSFVSVTTGAPVTDGGYSETCTWGDYDNDGRIDLYVTNSGSPSLGAKTNFLYHNDGGGSFTRITAGVIVTDARYSRGATWVDYDNDGDMDMYVANERNQVNNLYRNLLHETGSANFTRVTTGAPVTDAASSWSASWGDIDNDGDLDLFVANGWPAGQNDNLYLNNGDSTFTKVTSGPVVTDAAFSATGGWGDYDNDGDLDLFVTTAYSGTVTPNLLYRNMLRETDTLSFEKITTGDVVTDLGNAYGFSWGDYDRDGDLDLYLAKTTNEAENNAMYRNDTPAGNHWLEVRCAGVTSNRSGIGTRVFAVTGNGVNRVRQLRVVEGQSGYCGQNLELHFGLGTAAVLETLLVVWPSGTVDLFTGVAADRFLTLTEGESHYATQCALMRDGWNLVSIPVNRGADSVTVLYPGRAQGCAFGYLPGSGYQEHCVLEPGRGYWLKCTAGTACQQGFFSGGDTIAVQPGWNLIPGISVSVPVGTLLTEPAGIIESNVFGFDGTYASVSVLEPGRAYWVKVREAGTVVLAAPGSAARISQQEEGE
jgi:enediyne biosynthesis protein E4